ncbi:MAG: hypothetical protein Kow0074_23090 [Candidatus Zixiibacteriota bacterium]
MRFQTTVLATLLIALVVVAFAPAVNAQSGPAIPAACEPLQGTTLMDQNGDGFLDAVDLNLMIGVLFFGAKEYFIGVSDFNGDGFGDAVDMNEAINQLFFGGPAPSVARTIILKGRLGPGRWYLVDDPVLTYLIGDDQLGVFSIGEDGAGLLDCANCPKTDSLYIPQGLTITGSPSLVSPSAFIVRRSGYVHAVGTSDAPIVFTSSFAEGQRARGDWGGVVINGCAYNNAIESGYLIQAEGDGGLGGGTCDEDNSGCFKYIRVQFAGREFTLDNELNGITLNSVGGGTPVDGGGPAGGTTLEYVQVLQNDDDGIEWFGGSCNVRYAVIAGVKDDGLDSDWGAEWRGQYIVIVRDPDGSRSSGYNGFEWDGTPEGPALQPCPRMKPTVWNVSVIGGGCDVDGRYLAGPRTNVMHIRTGADANINNLVGTEHATILEFDDFAGAYTMKDCDYPVRHDSILVGVPNADSLREINHSIFYQIGWVSDNSGGATDATNSYEGYVLPLGSLPTGVPSGNAASTNVMAAVPGDGSCVKGTNPLFVDGIWPSGPAGNPWFPDFRPIAGDPRGVGINTPGAVPTDAWFDPSGANFKGAFAENGTDWTTGWTLFRRD